MQFHWMGSVEKKKRDCDCDGDCWTWGGSRRRTKTRNHSGFGSDKRNKGFLISNWTLNQDLNLVSLNFHSPLLFLLFLA